MIIAVLLIICAIVFILALLYILGCLVEKHMLSRQKKYQEHIDSMVTELFPPSIPAVQAATSVHTSTQTPTVQQPTVYESDTEYQEAKRKMIADIRTYFNRRKIDATLAKVQSSEDFVSIRQSIPTPPSVERLIE